MVVISSNRACRELRSSRHQLHSGLQDGVPFLSPSFSEQELTLEKTSSNDVENASVQSQILRMLLIVNSGIFFISIS